MALSFVKKKLKKILVIAVLLCVTCLMIVYVSTVCYPLVLSIAQAKTREAALAAINDAGTKIRALESFYESYYTYTRNNEGEIILVTANTSQINQLNIYSQKVMQDCLTEFKDFVLNIPFGAFTGSSILAGMGPLVGINISQVGTAETVLHSEFYAAGINQTIHKLMLTVKAEIEIIIPFKAEDIEIVTDLLIAEDIIIGRVPDTYITGISDENIFDLVPN